MPALFIGHGSPMNALANSAYTQSLQQMGQRWPAPQAIVVISAHWQTQGTWVTAMLAPKTIHDFYGFPQALFDITYPAPGNPELALEIQKSVSSTTIQLESRAWGLDHGAWAVLLHMYPDAKIPIVQLSMDSRLGPEGYYRIGQELKFLREKGVMILGSGNVVHNLRKINWQEDAPAFVWAIEFDEWIKKKITERDHDSLLQAAQVSEAARWSVPTTEHLDPLFFVLGASDPSDRLKFEFEQLQNASISMRSWSYN